MRKQTNQFKIAAKSRKAAHKGRADANARDQKAAIKDKLGRKRREQGRIV